MAWRTPLGILKALAEHHVAAALAMHWPRRGEAGEALAEAMRGGEPSGMQLGVSARQPACVATLGRRLVGEGREGHDLGARLAPALDQMRVDEGEGFVARQRDAHAGWRQRGRATCAA